MSHEMTPTAEARRRANEPDEARRKRRRARAKALRAKMDALSRTEEGVTPVAAGYRVSRGQL